MAEYGIRFERGFSLHEALAMLEEGDELVENVDSVTIFPPNNAWKKAMNCGQTDEQDNRGRALSRLEPDNTIFSGQTDEQDNRKSPLELFSLFFDDEILDMIVNESNRYANQKNHHTKIEKSEIKAFIGVLLLSGYMHVPRRRMFWEYERDSHNLLVSEAISRNTFEYVLSHFHLTDNTKIETSDKFAKVRPLFQHLNKKYLEHSLCEEMHSVDEAMVPYFGRHGCKQFIHGKPIRYGYKLWWFEPYQGASTNISTKYSGYGVGPAVVLEYADVLKKKWPNVQMHLFFDNFFSTLPLLELLSNNNLRGTGTIRENRIPASPLMDSKRMKKQPRGSYDYRKVDGENIIVVKWHDNSIVTVCSNSAGVNPVHSVKRFSQKEKKNNSDVLDRTYKHTLCYFSAEDEIINKIAFQENCVNCNADLIKFRNVRHCQECLMVYNIRRMDNKLTTLSVSDF
ncbi:Transposase IS4 [Popillia japonica]|uniref:Transposase IS4 n=1 Tax=Popillia japonica TaxID=7064 RepID=A0AAW1N7F4_POPJA